MHGVKVGAAEIDGAGDGAGDGLDDGTGEGRDDGAADIDGAADGAGDGAGEGTSPVAWKACTGGALSLQRLPSTGPRVSSAPFPTILPAKADAARSRPAGSVWH